MGKIVALGEVVSDIYRGQEISAVELGFAGHPTVGTAVLLGLRDGGVMGREIVL